MAHSPIGGPLKIGQPSFNNLKQFLQTGFSCVPDASTYLYSYGSDVSIHSDERDASHKLAVSLRCDVRVTPVWSPGNNPAEKLVRFQVTGGSYNKNLQHRYYVLFKYSLQLPW